jgi:hypothetical protein
MTVEPLLRGERQVCLYVSERIQATYVGASCQARHAGAHPRRYRIDRHI